MRGVRVPRLGSMHTVTTFVASFEEFSETDDELVQAKLNEAELLIDLVVWGKFATLGHGYMTAHLLAMSPGGNAAKLVKNDSTTYEQHYKRLVRIATAGLRNT